MVRRRSTVRFRKGAPVHGYVFENRTGHDAASEWQMSGTAIRHDAAHMCGTSLSLRPVDMLVAWACELVRGSDRARFSDPEALPPADADSRSIHESSEYAPQPNPHRSSANPRR